MANKEKFLALVSKEKTDSLERNRDRIKNRAMLRESQKIALKVLLKLDELGWKQTDLAREMGVSPQQISKIVSGKENLSIETQVKLQTILDIPVLASYYEDKMKQSQPIVCVKSGQSVTYEPAQDTPVTDKRKENIAGQVSLKVVYNSYTDNAA